MSKKNTLKPEKAASVGIIAGYTFDKVSLLEEAMTHPSLSGGYNYQRLEFLGDRVLGLVIADWLLALYPGEAEGVLNQRFSALVRRETLAEIALKLGIDKTIKVAAGAETEGTRQKETVLCDVCESLIGAIFLDRGYTAAETFIHQHWADLTDQGPNTFKDAKGQLQEWAQARAKNLPEYDIVHRSGPDHNPLFTIKVTVAGCGSAQAKGVSKRIAEQAAAKALLVELINTHK